MVKDSQEVQKADKYILGSDIIESSTLEDTVLVAQQYLTLLRPLGLQPTRLLCPWDFPGKNTRVGCHFLLQGILPTQGLNPHLLHWQADSLQLSHQGSPLFTLVLYYLGFFGCAPFGEGREYNGARFSIVIVPAPTSHLDCYEVLLSTGK